MEQDNGGAKDEGCRPLPISGTSRAEAEQREGPDNCPASSGSQVGSIPAPPAMTDDTPLVTQADRDAAVAAGLYLYGEGKLSAMERGDLDDHPFVQAFARHRLAASQSSAERIASLEARVAELEAGISRFVFILTSDGKNDDRCLTINHPELIAALDATRQLLNKGSEPCPK